MSKLNRYSNKMAVPKNKIIERALHKYFEELKKTEYAKSFIKAAKDQDILDMADEGLDDYVEILKRYE
jgi:hypothetical protein